MKFLVRVSVTVHLIYGVNFHAKIPERPLRVRLGVGKTHKRFLAYFNEELIGKYPATGRISEANN
jgi:hypothetical protein